MNSTADILTALREAATERDETKHALKMLSNSRPGVAFMKAQIMPDRYSEAALQKRLKNAETQINQLTAQINETQATQNK